MIAIDWTRVKMQGRRIAAGAPALLAALGVAMAASSTPRPVMDRTAEAVARATRGDLTDKGLAAMTAGMTPSQLAQAIRADPNERQAALYGLTPGWESLTLAGKPTLELGANGLEAQRMNAAMPVTSGALRPALPFVFRAASEADRKRAERCLTQGIYYEAALESTEGQEAVAQVILNRVRDPNYPSSICGVVFEGAERNTGCQFSFTCDGAMNRPPSPEGWARAKAVATAALNGSVASYVGMATHYHADYVSPYWAERLVKLRKIGVHIFYRWTGAWGQRFSFTREHTGEEPVIAKMALVTTPMEALDAPIDPSLIPPPAIEVDTTPLVVAPVQHAPLPPPEPQAAPTPAPQAAPPPTPAPTATNPLAPPTEQRQRRGRIPVPSGW